MRFLVLICIVFSLWACKEELDGECSSPFKITVKAPILKDNQKVFIVDIHKNSNWWIDNITLNGKSIELDKSVATNKNFVYDNELFILERVNDQSLHISLKDEANAIKLVVGVQSGNCFSGFTIDQLQ